MKKFKIVIVSAFALVIALSTSFFFGCGQRDYSKINFNEVTHSIFYAPFYAAINLGYFEEEGLEINLTNGGGSNVSMAALVSGSADMILAGPETVVYTSQEGVTDQPKVFGQLTQTDGSFIVAKNKSDKPFEITDLIGKTIIGGRAGGLPAMTLQYAVESYGLEIGTGENQVNINDNVAFNNIASEFVNSDAEYCTLFEPNASNLIAEHPEYEIVASVGSLVNNTNIPYTCFIAKDSYLNEHADICEKFLKAVRKAYDFLKNCYETDNLESAAEALLPSFEGMTLKDMEIAVKAYYSINAFSSNPVMSKSAFEMLLEITENAGMLNGNTNYESVVNTEIAKKITA